jgi:hypothetical protein
MVATKRGFLTFPFNGNENAVIGETFRSNNREGPFDLNQRLRCQMFTSPF